MLRSSSGVASANPMSAGLAEMASAATNVGRVLVAARLLYQKFTELPVYNRDDLARYNVLENAYRAHVAPAIPTEWVLTGDKDKRPTHDYQLGAVSDALMLKLKQIRLPYAGVEQCAVGMLNTIIKLLDSLSKRTTNKIRSGSVEAMFFVEFACWIEESLPSFDFKSPADLERLRRVKIYCETIKREVIIADKPGENNPLGAIESIITDLNGIIEAMETLIKLATFNDHIERLDNAVLSMAAQTFHTMRLMLSGAHDHESHLPVATFLDPAQTHRPKIKTFKEQHLAQWLERTLRAAGITCNDFHHRKQVTLLECDRHLEGEVIDDPKLTLPKSLNKNVMAKEWGHWPFMLARIQEEISAAGTSDSAPMRLRAEMKAMQTNIRQIYRDVLSLYFLREQLANIRNVAPTYGEVWLYGDQTGQAVVMTLMHATENFTARLHGSLRQYHDYCQYRFETVKREKVVDSKDNAYKAMIMGAAQFEQFSNHYQLATTHITAIRTACNEFSARHAKAQESKRQLMRGMLAYLEYCRMQGTPHYRLLQEALSHDVAVAAVPVPVSKVVGGMGGPMLDRITLEPLPERKMGEVPELTATASLPAFDSRMGTAKASVAIQVRTKPETLVQEAASVKDIASANDERESIEVISIDDVSSIAPKVVSEVRRIHISKEMIQGQVQASTLSSQTSAVPASTSTVQTATPVVSGVCTGVSAAILNSATGRPRVAAELPLTLAQPRYDAALVSVAHRVQQLLTGQIQSSFRTLPEWDDFEEDFHRKLYQKVLLPYKKVADYSPRLAFMHGYSTEQIRTLRIYQARFVDALETIMTSLYPIKRRFDRNYEFQLQIVNTCLYAALNEMAVKMMWHEPAKDLFVSMARLDSFVVSAIVTPTPLKRLDDGQFELTSLKSQLLSAELRVAEHREEAEEAKAAEAASRQEKDKSDQRAEASDQRAEASKQRAEASDQRAEASKKKEDAAVQQNAALQLELEAVRALNIELTTTLSLLIEQLRSSGIDIDIDLEMTPRQRVQEASSTTSIRQATSGPGLFQAVSPPPNSPPNPEAARQFKK